MSVEPALRFLEGAVRLARDRGGLGALEMTGRSVRAPRQSRASSPGSVRRRRLMMCSRMRCLAELPGTRSCLLARCKRHICRSDVRSAKVVWMCEGPRDLRRYVKLRPPWARTRRIQEGRPWKTAVSTRHVSELASQRSRRFQRRVSQGDSRILHLRSMVGPYTPRPHQPPSRTSMRHGSG